MEGEARVPAEPFSNLGMLVGGVVVEDDVDRLSSRHLCFDQLKKADEFLVAVPLHVAADHGAIEHVERRKERDRAVALVVVGHCSGPSLLERQAGLRAIQRLDLALLVERQHDRVSGRRDVEPDDIA